MSALAEPDRFAAELRRWRTLRRSSQLQLAMRAGTTQRYMSFLEQGRSRPGRAMVVRLAESLGLSLRERSALLASAGYAPVFRRGGRSCRPGGLARSDYRCALDKLADL